MKKKYLYMTASKKKWKHLKVLSREHRKNMTDAEAVVWELIRKEKLGAKFRRQHVIDEYIVDFVCLELKLIIEIDGEIHKKRKDYDEYRTRWLEGMRYKELRFKNKDVFENIIKVEKELKKAIEVKKEALGVKKNVK